MVDTFWVPVSSSPLSATFQHMPLSELEETVAAYEQFWQTYGAFPQIKFAPLVIQRLLPVPTFYIATSWSIAQTLIEQGVMDEKDPRRLQEEVPLGLHFPGIRMFMTMGGGKLSFALRKLGIPPAYPYLAKLVEQYMSFTMSSPGEPHDRLRAIYARPASQTSIRTYSYEATLRAGCQAYLDSVPSDGKRPVDLAALSREVMQAAVAKLFGVPRNLMDELIRLTRILDNQLIPRASPRQLAAADKAAAECIRLLKAAFESGAIAEEGIFSREYARLRAEGYERERYAYIALTLLRVSFENQLDALTLCLRMYANLASAEKEQVQANVGAFVRRVVKDDAPVGFILRKLPQAFTFPTPVAGKTLVLPKNSYVVVVPNIMSRLRDDGSGDYLVTFGYGQERICPGRYQGLLTVTVCLEELLRHFDLAASEGETNTSDNPFFRRILHLPGILIPNPLTHAS